MAFSEEGVQVIVNKAVAQFSLSAPAPLSRYLADVLEWNSVLSLVSRKDPLAACERLLFESIELGQLLDVEHVGRLADVGSGAGFPGMVWALMAPQLKTVLIERREKRALFLERTSRALGAGNVTVLASDLKDVSRETPLLDSFELVTAVAVGDPAEIADDVSRLLVDGGRFASTVARETRSSDQLGSSLTLEKRVEGKFGCYVVYRRGV